MENEKSISGDQPPSLHYGETRVAHLHLLPTLAPFFGYPASRAPFFIVMHEMPANSGQLRCCDETKRSDNITLNQGHHERRKDRYQHCPRACGRLEMSAPLLKLKMRFNPRPHAWGGRKVLGDYRNMPRTREMLSRPSIRVSEGEPLPLNWPLSVISHRSPS